MDPPPPRPRFLASRWVPLIQPAGRAGCDLESTAGFVLPDGLRLFAPSAPGERGPGAPERRRRRGMLRVAAGTGTPLRPGRALPQPGEYPPAPARPPQGRRTFPQRVQQEKSYQPHAIKSSAGPGLRRNSGRCGAPGVPRSRPPRCQPG